MRKVWYHQIWIQTYFCFIVLILMIMPLCNRMFCCIFGRYFYIEIRQKYEKNIQQTYSFFIVYPCGQQWGYMEKSYKMQQNILQYINKKSSVHKWVHEVQWAAPHLLSSTYRFLFHFATLVYSRLLMWTLVYQHLDKETWTRLFC